MKKLPYFKSNGNNRTLIRKEYRDCSVYAPAGLGYLAIKLTNEGIFTKKQVLLFDWGTYSSTYYYKKHIKNKKTIAMIENVNVFEYHAIIEELSGYVPVNSGSFDEKLETIIQKIRKQDL